LFEPYVKTSNEGHECVFEDSHWENMKRDQKRTYFEELNKTEELRKCNDKKDFDFR